MKGILNGDKMVDVGVKVEIATVLDIQGMRNLWGGTSGIGIGVGDDELSLQAFIARNPTTNFVLKDKGEIVGTVLGGFDGRRGYIYHLAVQLDYQDQGYGKLLLEQATSALQEIGAQRIHLFVLTANERAIAFYKTQNWEMRDLKIFSWED